MAERAQQQEPEVSDHITATDRKQKACVSDVRLTSKPWAGDVDHSVRCFPGMHKDLDTT